MALTLYTVGHGTLPADELARLLRDAGVEGVVDIRSRPGSRRHPQFARAEMERWLPERGIGYRWEPRLGGRRSASPTSPHTAVTNAGFRGYADYMETPEFVAALHDVLGEAAGRPTTVMCAESVWWRCHRRLVADAATLLRDATVRHLFHDGRLADHPPMPEARVDDGRLVYDGGSMPLPGTRAG